MAADVVGVADHVELHRGIGCQILGDFGDRRARFGLDVRLVGIEENPVEGNVARRCDVFSHQRGIDGHHLGFHRGRLYQIYERERMVVGFRVHVEPANRNVHRHPRFAGSAGAVRGEQPLITGGAEGIRCHLPRWASAARRRIVGQPVVHRPEIVLRNLVVTAVRGRALIDCRESRLDQLLLIVAEYFQ